MVRPFFTPPPREAASIKREEFCLELILQINSFINGIVWGPIMLFLLVGTGVYLTVRCGCLQARKFGFMLRSTLGSLFRKTDKASGGQNLTPFQAVSTALAGTVGTGNIAGVTGAIFAGGPGAVFWMWVSAFFGMMTKYAEIVLAVKYRQVDGDGTHFGGPMYYIEKGTGHKWLAVLFALLGGVACFGIGNIAQSTEIAGAMQSLVGLPPLYTGILLAILTAFVVIGGVKRIGQVASYLVPFMAIFYIVAGVAVILLRINDVPAVLASIFTEAFSFRAVGGGVFGYAILVAMRQGFARGVFSNEAGLGSAPMAHAASNTRDPAEQGMWGIFEVFADTMVVCTLTALVLLTSGFVDLDTGRIAAGAAGSALVGQAFDAVFGALGSKLIAVCILLFAYSTTLGWSCYGCKAVEYLFGAGAGAGYRVLFVALMPVGAVMRLDLAWTLSDTFNGLMMLPNLIGVIALSGTVVRITQNYLARKLHGSPAPPLLRPRAESER